MFNKRGQFFLVAAIVIIGTVAGLTGVTNYAKSNTNNEVFYDLSKSIGFESKRVLDYGIYNSADTDTMIKDFLFKYSDYFSKNEEAIFIYGNNNNLQGLHFKATKIGSVGLNLNGKVSYVPIIRNEGKKAKVWVINENSRVVANIDNLNYTFDLKKGENFFFVLAKVTEDKNGEKFVTEG